MANNAKTETGSFRDPAGFVFYELGKLYRQINKPGREDYDLFMSSGLYQKLANESLIVKHKETNNIPSGDGYKIIQPEVVPFISYPYEWSFSQLKDAALLTLKVQKIALELGMELKDASAYNVQFVDGKPMLIDTLSFQNYIEGKPWQAYKQFCQHFLAPLALMAKTDIDLCLLMRDFIDGVPLPLASKLLPTRSSIKPSLLIHIGLHSRSQQRYAGDSKVTGRNIKVSKNSIIGIVGSLERAVKNLKLKPVKSEWADYYSFTNYNDRSFSTKRKLVSDLVQQARAKTVLDLGANNGLFSRVAAEFCDLVISADVDPMAVEENYQTVKSKKESKIVPIRLDLTNPSPALGWANDERYSFSDRAKTDVVMALALIHHLAISNNLPLEKIAEYFKSLAPKLIIEFVPKEDSQVKKLLKTREDIFPNYNIEGFEAAFGKFYTIEQRKIVAGTKRTMYLLRARR